MIVTYLSISTETTMGEVWGFEAGCGPWIMGLGLLTRFGVLPLTGAHAHLPVQRV